MLPLKKFGGHLLRRGKLSLLNDCLTVVVIVLALYIFLIPLLPGISWWARHEAPIVSRPVVHAQKAATKLPPTNTLVIPSIDLTRPILEGTSVNTVNRGVWHRPASGVPPFVGNTVLVGHRFTYSGQGVFFNLDKIRPGDQVIVYWDKKAYEYRVTRSIVVPATDMSVEAPTQKSTLTLYTCTPLWTFTHRLVITAELAHAP